MQSFRTILPDFSTNIAILPDHRFLGMGSCFAANIGARLERARWVTATNPFGILYHPFPIADGLDWLMGEGEFDESSIFNHQNQWHSFQHHGSFSAEYPAEALEKMNEYLKLGRKGLEKADFLILTFGTAFGFYEKATNRVVANCHKVDGHLFERKLTSLDELKNRYQTILKNINTAFPDLKILVTVSPVRHIRDGLVSNQRSKATLLLLADWMESTFEQVHYFPAYELMMDDLRDYRFYKNDLIHPTDLAVDYIWDFFVNNYFSEKAKTYLSKINKIITAMEHRPIRPDSEAHQLFVKKTEKAMRKLEEEYPHLKV